MGAYGWLWVVMSGLGGYSGYEWLSSGYEWL